MSLYERYHNFVKKILLKNDISNFKNHNDYRYMLEHVSFEEGLQYYNFIISKFNLTNDEIYSFCIKNDSIGNPIKFNYSFGNASPTSLRYILHSLLILEYIQSLELNNLDIIELGGGYGGLCLCMYHFASKFNLTFNYNIIDLKYAGELQLKYLEKHSVTANCLEPYGESLEGNNYFLISNYCFAEIDITSQKTYIELLFPKVQHGFITWNEYLDPYDFGFKCKIIDEFPQTGVKNKYIYF